MIEIDGAYGEGGGQVVRTAVSLAALTGQSVEITNVRGGRPKPGLKPQHLMAVRAAATLCRAELTGDAVGSLYLRFEPQQEVGGGDFRLDIGTAGATTLVAQTVLVPLAHAAHASSVIVTGGTYNPHAPTSDYLEQVYIPALNRLGIQATVTSPTSGYLPQGGGEVVLTVVPSRPTPIDWAGRGALRDLSAVVTTSNLPAHLADRGKATIEDSLDGFPVKAVSLDKPSIATGAAVTLSAAFDSGFAGFTGLGRKGVPMERVAEAPCEEFRAFYETDACVDPHLADQLVLPLVLAGGESRYTTSEATLHLRTVLWLASQFLPVSYEIEKLPGRWGVRISGNHLASDVRS